ncbi:MAG TPA: type 2 isopentenyl-diphosphate Delta-isomerase [Thermoplasmata archaeon]|nr:type 2 isopentenyl-diphosphate Delta-isomerase [Thermoplasmata archaeon]
MERSRGRSGGSRSTGAGPTREPRSPDDRTGLDLSHRKAEHVKVVLGRNVDGRYRYWDDVQLVHRALPELDFDEVDPSVTLLGHSLRAPIVITGMTGGFPDAAKINENLARAAAEVGVAMGVGSERAAVLKGQYPESYACVARHPVPLKFANIGAPQLIPQGPGDRVLAAEDVRAAMELIGADVLAVHLNFLQEMVQPEGDRRAKGCLARIGELARTFPVLVKETGAGLSREVAESLRERGVRAFDVSGTGGTSFAAVEHYRAVDQGAEREARVGKTFWDWGIPSPVSVVELVPLGVPVIASGGIRTGLDVARAIALGASAAGTAGGVLRAASTGYAETKAELETLVHELRVAMFLTGSPTVAALRSAATVVIGETRAWLRR